MELDTEDQVLSILNWVFTLDVKGHNPKAEPSNLKTVVLRFFLKNGHFWQKNIKIAIWRSNFKPKKSKLNPGT